MKSGLEGRNNLVSFHYTKRVKIVSMKSGLEGRNNWKFLNPRRFLDVRLNEVRPRRPEQSKIHGYSMVPNGASQ